MAWRLGRITHSHSGRVTVQVRDGRWSGRPRPPLHLRCVGWLVLVDLHGDTFTTVRVVDERPTPSRRLPPVPALRQAVETRVGPLHLVIETAGEWCLDSLGRPCELGRVRHIHTDDGPDLGSWVGLVNYTGHRLADLDLGAAIVHHSTVDGAPWLVLTDVPEPPFGPEGEREELSDAGAAQSRQSP